LILKSLSRFEVLKNMVSTDLNEFEEHKEKFASIKTPTLILWGKNDKVTILIVLIQKHPILMVFFLLFI
jgi:hypothetical protein